MIDVTLRGVIQLCARCRIDVTHTDGSPALQFIIPSPTEVEAFRGKPHVVISASPLPYSHVSMVGYHPRAVRAVGAPGLVSCVLALCGE